MRKTGWVLLLSFAGLVDTAGAQSAKLDFGLAIPLYIKYNVAYGEDTYKRLFGCMGLDAVLKVQGPDENSMTLLVNAGVVRDDRPFRLDVGSKLTVRLYSLNFSPSVMIPSKWAGVQYHIGIGALVRLGQQVDFSTGTASQGFYYTSIDTVDKALSRNSRSLVPFIMMGASFRLGKHLRLQATIQPTLLDFYEPGTHTSFTTSFAQHDFVMAYQPVYVGVKLYYFFRSNQ